MSLPTIGDGEQVGDGNRSEQLNVGAGTQAVRVGGSGATFGVLGATPVAQKAFVATLSINALSVSGVVGFTSSTSLSALVTAVNNITAYLAAYGLTAAS